MSVRYERLFNLEMAALHLSTETASGEKLINQDLFSEIFNLETGGPRLSGVISLKEKSFTERFDSNKLAFIVNNLSEFSKLYRESARDSVALDKYYAASDDGIIDVRYKQSKKNLRGRYTALGSMSGQNMVREARHTIYDGLYVDVDMDNCHPVLTVWMCDRLGIECSHLRDYVDNRESRIKEILDLNPDQDREKVKRLFLTINYGGSNPFEDIKKKTSFLKAYFKESASIKSKLCAKFKAFKELSDKHNKVSKKDFNLEGSAVAHLCAFVENQMLMRVLDYLRTHDVPVNECILCFDGVMIPIDSYDDSFLTDLEDLFESMGIDMKFSTKPFKPVDLEAMGYDEDEEYVVEDSEEVDGSVARNDRIYELLCCLDASHFEQSGPTCDLFAISKCVRGLETDDRVAKKTLMDAMIERTGSLDKVLLMRAFDWESPNEIKETYLIRLAKNDDPVAYAEWEANHRPSKALSDDKLLPSDRVVAATRDGMYRRVEGVGCVYKQILPYYFKLEYPTPIKFLNGLFAEERWYQMLETSSRKALKTFITEEARAGFPWMKVSYNHIGFSNGVYDLSRGCFLSGDDIPDGIQVRTMLDVPFADTETPIMDSVFAFQEYDSDELDFVYFMLGRCLTRLTDRFDFMTMLHGEGGSGKSLIANLIKHSFGGTSQVGILGVRLESKFGLDTFADKQIVCCDDMPRNLPKVVDRGDFLSMMSRGAISCPVKNGSPIVVESWDIPTLINANHLPTYKDERGEIIRRVQIIDFPNVVPDDQVDTTLEARIKATEFGAFIHRCRSTYLRYTREYVGKKPHSFAPPRFLGNSDELRNSLNISYRFATDCLVYKKDSTVSKSVMTRYLRAYVKDLYSLPRCSEKLSPADVTRIDDGVTFKSSQYCKSCTQRHLKGCCADYSRTNRMIVDTFHNVSVDPACHLAFLLAASEPF